MTTTEPPASTGTGSEPASTPPGPSWKIYAALGFTAAWLLAGAGRLAGVPPVVGWSVIGLIVAALVAVRAVAARRRGAE